MSLTGQLRSLLVCHYHGAGRCHAPGRTAAMPLSVLPSLPACLSACVASVSFLFRSFPIPFSCFHYYILGAFALPSPRQPHLPSPSARARAPWPWPPTRGSCFALSSALVCSTRQRAADFNSLYSCYGLDAILNILYEGEVGITKKHSSKYSSCLPWRSYILNASSPVHVCQQTTWKTGSPMGLFGLPLFPSSLAEQERGASESE